MHASDLYGPTRLFDSNRGDNGDQGTMVIRGRGRLISLLERKLATVAGRGP